jgi:hypothetical protein
VSQDPADHPSGVLPGGDPDDVAGASTSGSDGDGPEAGYTPAGQAEAEQGRPKEQGEPGEQDEQDTPREQGESREAGQA